MAEQSDEAPLSTAPTPVWESGLRLLLGKPPREADLMSVAPPTTAATSGQTPTAPVATPAPAPVSAPAAQPTPTLTIQPDEQPKPAAPTVVPVTETQTTTVKGLKPSKAVTDAQADLYERQGQSIDAQAELKQKQAADEATRLADMRREQDAVKANFQSQRAQLQSQTRDQMAKVDSALDDLRKAPNENPEPSGGQKAIDGLAAMLGAFGSGLTGGPNAALQTIENRINRRIAAQRADLEKNKDRVNLERNQLAFLLNKGLDDRQAEAAMRTLGWEEAQQDMKLVAAKYGGEAVAQQATQMHQALDAKRIDSMAEQEVASQNRSQSQSVTKNVSTAPKMSDLKDVQEMVLKDPTLKSYRDARTAVDRFRNLRAAGADGAALADFVAGDGGLKQGSFGPSFTEMLKKRGLFGQTVEDLRAKFAGGVDPKLLDEIDAGLSANLGTAATRAAPSIRTFREMGAPGAWITGGQTADDVAAQLGAKSQ